MLNLRHTKNHIINPHPETTIYIKLPISAATVGCSKKHATKGFFNMFSEKAATKESYLLVCLS
jgi:hypothetical protein